MSVSKDRQVTTYPPEKYKKLLVGYVQKEGGTESSAAAKIIKEFFDKMTPQQRSRLMAAAARTNSENMY